MASMTALGRILQVIGWVWIAVGFFGPMVNLPNVSVFPGIIILFISRVIRKQGEQPQPREESADQDDDQVTPRPLNTQRSTPPAVPRKAPQPPPATQTEARAKSMPEPKPAPKAPEAGTPPDERGELLERVLLVGQELAEEPAEHGPLEPISDDLESRPLSSAEMIARAHRRWDRRP